MKIAAIIAEYNPFHKGHQYHIAETKRLTGADYILILMSGNFVQRGAPALCNKYIRTKMALLNGADAVLELPSLYALSSAEYFAQGAVALLNRLGCVSLLSFGSEEGSLSELISFAEILLEEPASYQTALEAGLKEGLSFPLARNRALNALLSSENKALLKSPNNILGVEYCKALLASKSSIQPFTIQRKGKGYHDLSFSSKEGHFASASAIRSALFSTEKEALADTLSASLPKTALSLLKEHQAAGGPLSSEDFSSLLFYKLLSEKEQGFDKYLDCSKDFSDKICKHLPSYVNFSDFCEKLKSKDITHTRVSRILFHILLNMERPESYALPPRKRQLPVFYARLLGFRKDSAPLLSAIKKSAGIPLLTKLADAPKLLQEDAFSLLEQDIFSSHVYEAIASAKTGLPPINEYRRSPIIL